MTRLSKYQAKVINQMREEGSFLWTNEGGKLRAWLGNESGEVSKYVRRDTASKLYNLGLLTFSDGDYKDKLYRYSLKRK